MYVRIDKFIMLEISTISFSTSYLEQGGVYIVLLWLVELTTEVRLGGVGNNHACYFKV